MSSQPRSLFHILAIAASSRMSNLAWSDMFAASSATASMAKVVAAIRPRSCATASCLPMGWPHCTRVWQ